MLDIIQYCFVCSSLLQQTTQNLTRLTLRNLTRVISFQFRFRFYNDKAETNKKKRKNHITVNPPPHYNKIFNRYNVYTEVKTKYF